MRTIREIFMGRTPELTVPGGEHIEERARQGAWLLVDAFNEGRSPHDFSQEEKELVGYFMGQLIVEDVNKRIESPVV